MRAAPDLELTEVFYGLFCNLPPPQMADNPYVRPIRAAIAVLRTSTGGRFNATALLTSALACTPDETVRNLNLPRLPPAPTAPPPTVPVLHWVVFDGPLGVAAREWAGTVAGMLDGTRVLTLPNGQVSLLARGWSHYSPSPTPPPLVPSSAFSPTPSLAHGLPSHTGFVATPFSATLQPDWTRSHVVSPASLHALPYFLLRAEEKAREKHKQGSLLAVIGCIVSESSTTRFCVERPQANGIAFRQFTALRHTRARPACP